MEPSLLSFHLHLLNDYRHEHRLIVGTEGVKLQCVNADASSSDEEFSLPLIEPKEMSSEAGTSEGDYWSQKPNYLLVPS